MRGSPVTTKPNPDAQAGGCLLHLAFVAALVVLAAWTHWTFGVLGYAVFLAQGALRSLARQHREELRRAAGLTLLARFIGLRHLCGAPPGRGKVVLLASRESAARKGLEFTDEEWERLAAEQAAFWRWYYERLPEEAN